MAPLLVFISLCLIWGFSWVAIKVSLEGFPPMLGAGLRFLIASLLLMVYAKWRRLPTRVPGNILRPLLASAGLIYVIDYGLIYWAEQHISAGVTAVVFATFPFFTALFGQWFCKSDSIRWTTHFGLAIALGGVALLFRDEWGLLGGEAILFFGVVAVLVSAMAAAGGTLIIKAQLTHLHPVTLSINQMLAGGAGLTFLAILAGEPQRVPLMGSTIGAGAVAGFLYLTVLASAVAFTFYFWLLQRVSAVTVASTVYFTPMVAMLGDRMIFERPLTRDVMLGTGLVLAGILLSEMTRRR